MLFHDDAEQEDVIQSILHAVKFHNRLAELGVSKEKDWSTYIAVLKESLVWTKSNMPKYITALKEKDWDIDAVYWNDG